MQALYYINTTLTRCTQREQNARLNVTSLTSVIKYNTHPPWWHFQKFPGLLVSRILTGSFLKCNHSFPWLAPSYLKFNIKIYSLLEISSRKLKSLKYIKMGPMKIHDFFVSKI